MIVSFAAAKANTTDLIDVETTDALLAYWSFDFAASAMSLV